ncbi:hypothetical protein B1H10_05020 [candidate division KSB1 bacterium 4484_188]|nr:MAG: hypothetical protein B1H10_05020 [candidate division KSB1 bacterium 4484_188]
MKIMRVSLNKYLLVLLLLILGCGGGRKLAKNPQPIGFVPFTSANVAGAPEDINSQLVRAIQSSGILILHPVDSIPGFWNLAQMQVVKDSAAQWVVTGRVDYENQAPEKGSKIPFLLNKPGSAISVKITYRLYNREKGGWADIGEIVVKKKKPGDYQLLEYNPADPSLSLNARERQLLRDAVYQEAANKLLKQIAKKMKIK